MISSKGLCSRSDLCLLEPPPGRLVGQDVSEELPVETGGGRRVPVDVEAGAEGRDLAPQQDRLSARLCTQYRSAQSIPARCLTLSVCLGLERLLARCRVADRVLGRHAETVGGERLECRHQEPRLVAACINISRLLPIVFPVKHNIIAQKFFKDFIIKAAKQ